MSRNPKLREMFVEDDMIRNNKGAQFCYYYSAAKIIGGAEG
jgi:hypothetical protein